VEVLAAANKIFGHNFNEKIFRTQLAYYKDLDYSEPVIFQSDFSVSEAAVRKFLAGVSLEK